MITVTELLYFLSLPKYTHVVVKESNKLHGLCGLGGGSAVDVDKRFGNRLVDWCFILDNIFNIVVVKE